MPYLVSYASSEQICICCNGDTICARDIWNAPISNGMPLQYGDLPEGPNCDIEFGKVWECLRKENVKNPPPPMPENNSRGFG